MGGGGGKKAREVLPKAAWVVGALEGKPAISTTAVATEGSLVKATQPSPRFYSSIAFPKHKLISGMGQLKTKVGKGRKKGEEGRLVQKGRTMRPLQPTAAKPNRKVSQDRTDERTSTIIFATIPQISPKIFSNKYPKYSHCRLAAFCQPSWASSFASARSRWVFGRAKRRQVRDIRQSHNRARRRSNTRWYNT